MCIRCIWYRCTSNLLFCLFPHVDWLLRNP